MRPLQKKSLVWGIVSPLAWPFVLLYAMAFRLKSAAYDLGLSKPRRLSWPVLSVGNLSIGGTGKTPMALLLARLLQERGWWVDVLSRGYGRDSPHVSRVDPNMEENAVEEFGDEPLLMARRGVSVYVGADRHQAGILAERDAIDTARPRRLHILDDGFQHRRLARAVDIVLLRREDLEDDMLPAGRLREPLSALERADICVLRPQDADLADRVLRLMRCSDPERVWIVERRTIVPAAAMSSRPFPPVLAFCAVGDPLGFFDGLRQAGITIQREIAFRDHHLYTHRDIERLTTAARESRAQYFMTTEKDSVRLSNRLRSELEEVFPLTVAGLELSLRDEDNCVAILESLLAQRLQIPERNVR